jgi:enterochelin esterase-like enzyme
LFSASSDFEDARQEKGFIMKTTFGFVFAGIALLASAIFSQPMVNSPEIGSNGSLSLRYYAPNAQQVTVNGELDGKAHPMQKSTDGVWSTTIDSLPPDIYTYWFDVDGIRSLDPHNTNTKLGYGMFGAVSVVEMPGDGPQFYDAKPVPHGSVRIQPYESKTLGLSRTVWIYTPPGYDQGKNYPVLYLLHGAGDVESGWTLIGRANLILDNLIAEGRAKSMVVVMPLGHAIQSFWTGTSKQFPDPVSKAFRTGSRDSIITAMFSGDGKGGLSPFAQDLVGDVMPMIEKTFKVSTKPEDRAIAGLSMGGGQAINLAFNRSDLFRYVIAMSPAVNGKVDAAYPKFFSDPSKANAQFKLFWVGVGRDDVLTGPGDLEFDEMLTRRGITHMFAQTDGRHEWTVWRHHLYDVAPLLFK